MLDLIAAKQQLNPNEPEALVPVMQLTFSEPVVDEATVWQDDQGVASRGRSIKQSIPARRVIYGEVHTGAPLFLYNVASPYLRVGYLLSDGEIESVDAVEIGGVRQGFPDGTPTSIPTDNLCTVSTDIGTSAQTIDQIISDAGLRPDSFRQAGVARAVVENHYGNNSEQHDELWGGGDVFQWTVQGVKISRPWLVGDAAAYRTTPALCLYDYLTRDWPGAIDASLINIDSFEVAQSAGDAAGFNIAAVVYADQSIATVLTYFLQACDGVLDFYDGEYHLIIDGVGASVLTLTDDDFTQPLNYEPARGIDAAPNIIRASYKTLDGDAEIIVRDEIRIAEEGERQEAVSYDFAASSTQAARLAGRRLRKYGRHYLSVVTHDAGLFLKLLDVITIESDALPAASGEYKVLARHAMLSGCQLVLGSYDPSHFED